MMTRSFRAVKLEAAGFTFGFGLKQRFDAAHIRKETQLAAVTKRGREIDLRHHAAIELRGRFAIRAGADLDSFSAHSRRARGA